MRLMASDAVAQALGLLPGMTLADARARVPELAVAATDAPADRRWLARMADACDCLTPLVAEEPPDGLLLDVTGCLHLFGGAAPMIARLAQQLRRFCGGWQLAMAGTPEGARALARFRPATPADPTAPAGALRALPVAALELGEEVERSLRRSGLKTLGDLADRPAGPLAARFGMVLIDRLDRLLGRCDSRIVPRRPPPALLHERRFAEPIATTEAALALIGALADEAARELERRQQGGRCFIARLWRTDGLVRELAVESSRPLRDPARIRLLFEEKVEALSDPLDPGFGFDLVRLAVPRTEPLAASQLALHAEAGGTEAVAELIDRLSSRIGRQRVRRFQPRDSHVPEEQMLALPAIEVPLPSVSPAAWPAPSSGEPPLRPLHLFDPPQPVDVVAAVPDGPPLRFRWRRVLHEVARAEGPERIAAQWWRLPSGAPGLCRDYYRVEDVRGRRFWLFRHGPYGEGGARPRWYLHGLFA